MQRLALTICIGLMLAIFTACRVDNGNSGGNPPAVCNQSTGVTYVGMGAQSTSYQGKTGIYNTGEAGFVDPLIVCPKKGAVIARIINESGYNFSLIHQNTPAIILNSGAATDFWNGQPVGGHYTAQYSGELTSAPNTLTVKVEWRQP